MHLPHDVFNTISRLQLINCITIIITYLYGSFLESNQCAHGHSTDKANFLKNLMEESQETMTSCWHKKANLHSPPKHMRTG